VVLASIDLQYVPAGQSLSTRQATHLWLALHTGASPAQGGLQVAAIAKSAPGGPPSPARSNSTSRTQELPAQWNPMGQVQLSSEDLQPAMERSAQIVIRRRDERMATS